MHNIFILIFLILTSISNSLARTSDSTWKEYSFSENGFKVALPSQPKISVVPLPAGDGALHTYQSIEYKNPPSQFSVFVGQLKRGIFETESMDAYLNGHVKSMVKAAENGKLLSSRHLKFRGLPALEYQFSSRIEETQYIARGVSFMIDGGHMRISMLHPAKAINAEAIFNQFLDSFQLIPIGYVATEVEFSDKRGIVFSPPNGWLQEPTKNAAQVARFSHLTRFMTLLAAGNPAYTCNTYQTERQQSGKLKSSSLVQLGDQKFLKLVTYEDVAKYNVRLLTVQYCLDSRIGAVVLAAAEVESMFPRWEKVFEGAASSVRVR